MELDYVDSIKLINTLRDKEKEQQMWDRWISLYPYMMLEQLKYVSYEEFKDMLKGNGKYKKLTAEEIYADVDSILEEFKTPKEGGG